MGDQEDSRIVTCKCGQQMKVPESALGKTGTCVGCGRKLRLTKQMTEMPSGMASADDPTKKASHKWQRASVIMKGPIKKLKELSDKELKQRKKLTPKECVIGGIALCLLIGTCLVIMDEDKPRSAASTDGGRAPSRSSSSKQWYEGGNLHGATFAQWRGATYQNKLATAADWLAASKWKGHLKSPSDFARMKVKAQILVNAVDQAVTVEEMDSLQVTESAAVIITLSNDLGP